MERVSIHEAAGRIRDGEIGVVPTDTLYGLVASVMRPDAVERVYRVRGRDEAKPCIVLLADMTDLGRFGVDPDEVSRERLSLVWPGAVSVVLPCPDPRWRHVHRGIGSIAFRVPADASLHEFLVATGPIIAPSANPAGMPPSTTADEAETYFGERIDFLVDGGVLRSESSTLARLEGGRLTVLRQGAVSIG